ncbi:MAG: hypothetical protein ACPGLY_27810 [Rubripirellula sp.]
MKILDVICKALFIVVAGHLIDTNRRGLLQVEEGLRKQVLADTVQQRRELQLRLCSSFFTHAGQAE